MTWPPQPGGLWMATERWPPTGLQPGIEGGELVVVLWGTASVPHGSHVWWQGEVLAPAGRRFIKAAEGDLIPGDDPRLSCNGIDAMV
jgi:hypothetical protein